MISHSSKSNICIAEFYNAKFNPNWHLSFSFLKPPNPHSSFDVIHDSPCFVGMSFAIYTLHTWFFKSLSLNVMQLIGLLLTTRFSFKLDICRMIPSFLQSIYKNYGHVLVLPFFFIAIQSKWCQGVEHNYHLDYFLYWKGHSHVFTSEYYRKWKNIQIVAKESFSTLSYDYLYMWFFWIQLHYYSFKIRPLFYYWKT